MVKQIFELIWFILKLLKSVKQLNNSTSAVIILSSWSKGQKITYNYLVIFTWII